MSACLRPDGVTYVLEGLYGVVFWGDVVEDELDLLLGRETVDRPGLEVVEGIVRWGKYGNALVRVVELAFDLGGNLCGC